MNLRRHTKADTRAIWAFVIIIMILFGIAAYGYLTGSWEVPS